MGLRPRVKEDKKAAPPALPPHGDDDSLDDDDLQRDQSQVMSLPLNLNDGGFGGPMHQSQSSIDTDRILKRANAEVTSEDSKQQSDMQYLANQGKNTKPLPNALPPQI